VVSFAPLTALKQRLVRRLRRLWPGSSAESSLLPAENLKTVPQAAWQIDFFDSSPDCMAVISETTANILRINAAFTRELGYEREDIEGYDSLSFPIFQDPACSQRLVAQLYGENKEGRVESTQLTRKDGSIVVMDVFLRHIDVAGERGAMLTARHVSERQKLLDSLLDSQQKFQRVFQHSADAIIISQPEDAQILEVNDSFLRISGYKRKQVINKSFVDLGLFPQLDEMKATAQDLLAFGSFRDQEVLYRRRDGETVPMLVSATLFEDKGKTLVMTIAKDLRELRTAQQQLRTVEQRFNRVFDNAPIGFLVLDQHLQIIQANRFASRLVECTNHELVGCQFTDLYQKEHHGSLHSLIQELDQDEDSTGKLEQVLVNFSGKPVWTQYSIELQLNSETDVATYMVQIEDISEVKDGRQKLQHMAHYDALTELPNRQLFTERLEQLIKRSDRTDQLAAVLHIDLDQFKRVNDTLGHEAGDQLLRVIAQRLRNCVRRQDTVARVSGDEFTVLLEDVKSVGAAQRVADKILEVMAQQLQVTEHELVITPSIGITLFPDDATTAGALLRNADLAMYQAKSNGRNNYQFFAQGMNERAVARLQIESELLSALHNGEFELYFQPKVALNDLSVVGAEALLRWHHPKRGTISPDEFIDVAEQSGAIIEIGRWVISEACRASREFSEHSGRAISVAINLSARQFGEPDLVNDIRRTVKREGADPANIEFEITETMLMNDVERAAKMLERLRKLGIGLAIDDFGTGYSSFNYLKRFPIRTVKIDRSFVMDIPHNKDDMAISAAVIAMSKQLNMSTVAEGVETREQLSFLQENGCQLAQGYLFGEALPKQEMLPLITPNLSIIGVKKYSG